MIKNGGSAKIIEKESVQDFETGCLIPSDFVSIIMSNQRYRIPISKLNKYPETLLGNVNKRNVFWIEHDQAFVFERRRDYVLPILEFYITVKVYRSCTVNHVYIMYPLTKGNDIQRNEYIDLEGFLDELEFFEVSHLLY